MLEATRMALPRWLLRRGLTLKSKMMSCTTRSMRERELSTLCMVPHCSRRAAFCQGFERGRAALPPVSEECLHAGNERGEFRVFVDGRVDRRFIHGQVKIAGAIGIE